MAQLIRLDDPDQLLSVEQTAELLCVSVATLNAWRSNGRHNLPYVRVGNRIRYRLSDLREWLQSRTTTQV